MDWMYDVEACCEWLGQGFWSKPVNAVTNLALLVATWVMARRVAGRNLPVTHRRRP